MAPTALLWNPAIQNDILGHTPLGLQTAHSELTRTSWYLEPNSAVPFWDDTNGCRREYYTPHWLAVLILGLSVAALWGSAVLQVFRKHMLISISNMMGNTSSCSFSKNVQSKIFEQSSDTSCILLWVLMHMGGCFLFWDRFREYSQC